MAHKNKHSQETRERFMRLMDRGFSAHRLSALAKGLIDRETLQRWKKERDNPDPDRLA